PLTGREAPSPDRSATANGRGTPSDTLLSAPFRTPWLRHWSITVWGRGGTRDPPSRGPAAPAQCVLGAARVRGHGRDLVRRRTGPDWPPAGGRRGLRASGRARPVPPGRGARRAHRGDLGHRRDLPGDGRPARRDGR